MVQVASSWKLYDLKQWLSARVLWTHCVCPPLLRLTTSCWLESGGLDQGDIYNIQGSGGPRTGIENMKMGVFDYSCSQGRSATVCILIWSNITSASESNRVKWLKWFIVGMRWSRNPSEVWCRQWSRARGWRGWRWTEVCSRKQV